MAELKEAFSSLSPIDFSAVPLDDLSTFLSDAFAHGELLANSVPRATDTGKGQCEPYTEANRATKGTETLSLAVVPPTRSDDNALHKAWGKPLKIKDNPLHVQVYKMAAHDRHGAWFARRGVHQGIGFTKFKSAMKREFPESLQFQDGPGQGAKRGLSGDKRLESKSVDGLGRLEVWQLSAIFGPVTPREFCSLLITSDNALSEDSIWEGESGESKGPPRHFMVISRPTTHPDFVPRKELVRGSYESVELIRELPSSSLGAGAGENGAGTPEINPVEWIMITRSDPGGTIPKFMVERGTPDSIVADVTKFLDWACQRDATSDEDDRKTDEEVEKNNPLTPGTSESKEIPETKESSEDQNGPAEQTSRAATDTASKEVKQEENASASPNKAPAPREQASQEGYLSSITKTVGTTMSGYLPFFHTGQETRYDDNEYDSDTSSSLSETSTIRTYDTANDNLDSREPDATAPDRAPRAAASMPASASSSENLHADPDGTAELVAAEGNKPTRNQEKELQKLAEKRAALDTRMVKAREADEVRLAEISHKEEKEQVKAREKHEKERKRQEERYERDIAKLEERRKKEEARLEERRKKARDKDVVAKAQREREEWRERCRVAEQENEILRTQMERLQRENTLLVARMSVEDVDKLRAGASSRSSGRSQLSHESKDSKDGKEGKDEGKEGEKHVHAAGTP